MTEPTLLSQFYVTLRGADAPAEFMRSIEHITVESSLHMPDMAVIRVHDPRLHWGDSSLIEPGTALKVESAVGDVQETLFDGEIVEIEPEYLAQTHFLVVRAFDRLHRLTYGRHIRSFANVSDAEMIETIAQEVGLRAHVAASGDMHDYMLQPNSSNLAFLQARAAALGYLLYVDGDTLHCRPPAVEDAPIALQWGPTLTEFRPRLTTIGQVKQVTVRGWDPDSCQEISGEVSAGQGAPQINERRTGGEFVQDAFHITASTFITDRPIRTQTTAERLAQAIANQHAGRFIEAEGTCRGNPALIAGTSVNISAVGDRFSGTYSITSAVHHVSADGYVTEFTVSGLNPVTLIHQLIPHRAVPGTGGLALGIVTDNQDPAGQGRVKVKFPWLSNDQTSHWIRMAVPGGGAARGIAFLPEVHDEVLIGFEMGDMQHPYVLGGLWNGRDAPPLPSDQLIRDGNVRQRVIRSRSGHCIVLDDDEHEGGIRIEDRNGNVLKLQSQDDVLTIAVQGNIALHADGDIALEARRALELKASEITVQARGPVDIDGAVIELN
jgi:phage protein D